VKRKHVVGAEVAEERGDLVARVGQYRGDQDHRDNPNHDAADREH
jgi:hypothetical protein